ncbi:MAG: sulfotransferase [Paracoccus sp. (in: a-proteobacteria)]|nr:sulfotransferase [Paracoccus sp. (in: a-proteobacteria)]
MDIAIFAVTQRTGSTLVQRLFNANPDTLIWGENGQALVRFIGMQRQALLFAQSSHSFRDDYLNERDETLDISCMSPAEAGVRKAVVAGMRAFLETLYPPREGGRIGFKEVTHPPMLIDLFKQAFPQAQTVFVARHPVSIWRSVPDSWGQDLERFMAAWARNTAGYGERGRIFWMEDVLKDPATQNDLCELAGITRADFDRVLGINVNATQEKDKKPASDITRIMEICGELIPPHIADQVRL